MSKSRYLLIQTRVSKPGVWSLKIKGDRHLARLVSKPGGRKKCRPAGRMRAVAFHRKVLFWA